MNENEIAVYADDGNSELPIRPLTLENIATTELRPLTPQGEELFLSEYERTNALIAYAERVRKTYRDNENGFRDGLLKLADTIIQGQSIMVACSCRNGAICHADIVKLALEKVIASLRKEKDRFL